MLEHVWKTLESGYDESFALICERCGKGYEANSDFSWAQSPCMEMSASRRDIVNLTADDVTMINMETKEVYVIPPSGTVVSARAKEKYVCDHQDDVGRWPAKMVETVFAPNPEVEGFLMEWKQELWELGRAPIFVGYPIAA